MTEERTESRQGSRLLIGAAGLIALGAALLFWVFWPEGSDARISKPAEREAAVAGRGELDVPEWVLGGDKESRRGLPVNEPAPLSLSRAPAAGDGRIRIEVEDRASDSSTFHLVIARIDDSKRTLHVQGDPEEVESPWESEPIMQGFWRVHVCRKVDRTSGSALFLDEQVETVFVQPGEVTELRFEFIEDPRLMGSIRGEVVTDIGEPPPALVGLWREDGYLVDGDLTQFFGSSNEFEFEDLPMGRYRVGAIANNYRATGWPAGDPLLAVPSRGGVQVSVLGGDTFQWVKLIPDDPSGTMPKSLEVHLVVDGWLLGGEDEIHGVPARTRTPPLGQYDVQWLVKAKGMLPELLSEADLLYLGEEPSLPLELRPGRGFIVLVLEASLLELAVINDGEFFVVSRRGLEGVELFANGSSLGRSRSAGILIGEEPPNAQKKNPRLSLSPESPWLLPLDPKGDPVADNYRDLFVLPLMRR